LFSLRSFSMFFLTMCVPCYNSSSEAIVLPFIACFPLECASLHSE
jgi:hypothetical protein